MPKVSKRNKFATVLYACIIGLKASMIFYVMTSSALFKRDRIFRSTKRIKSLPQRINRHSDILLLLRCRINLVSVYCNMKQHTSSNDNNSNNNEISICVLCVCVCVCLPNFGQQCNCITFDPVAGPSGTQNMDIRIYLRWNGIQLNFIQTI